MYDFNAENPTTSVKVVKAGTTKGFKSGWCSSWSKKQRQRSLGRHPSVWLNHRPLLFSAQYLSSTQFVNSSQSISNPVFQYVMSEDGGVGKAGDVSCMDDSLVIRDVVGRFVNAGAIAGFF